VWLTKYKKGILIGDAATRVKDLIRSICQEEQVQILWGHVSKDHIRLMLLNPKK
jgi:putative transposase